MIRVVGVGEEVQCDIVGCGEFLQVGGEENVPAFAVFPFEDAEEDEWAGMIGRCLFWKGTRKSVSLVMK